MKNEIIETLIHEARPSIVEGLLSQDAEALVAGFEQYLRSTLKKTYRRLTPKADEIALRIGRTIIKEISEVQPENRLEYVQGESLDQEIGDLDRNSWDIAEKSISDAPDLLALQAHASANLERILEICHLLEQKGLDWQKRYDRTLSEARLDCEFVLGDHSRSSMRLGRTISYLQSTGNWPPPGEGSE